MGTHIQLKQNGVSDNTWTRQYAKLHLAKAIGQAITRTINEKDQSFETYWTMCKAMEFPPAQTFFGFTFDHL